MKNGTRIRAELKAAGLTVKLTRMHGTPDTRVSCSGIIADRVVVFSGGGASAEEAWLDVEAEARARGLL